MTISPRSLSEAAENDWPAENIQTHTKHSIFKIYVTCSKDFYSSPKIRALLLARSDLLTLCCRCTHFIMKFPWKCKWSQISDRRWIFNEIWLHWRTAHPSLHISHYIQHKNTICTEVDWVSKPVRASFKKPLKSARCKWCSLQSVFSGKVPPIFDWGDDHDRVNPFGPLFHCSL